jgi:hypothetical protein
MWKNRINRPVKDLPKVQGMGDYKTGETHAPLNNHQPRTGTKHPRRKCHCKDVCGGRKRNTIGDQEKHWTKWNYD